MPFPRGRSLPPSGFSSAPLESTASDSAAYSFNRLIPILEYPTIGAGILSITFFFSIAFLSDLILARITPRTLGIAVTLSTLVLIGLIILILIVI